LVGCRIGWFTFPSVVSPFIAFASIWENTYSCDTARCILSKIEAGLAIFGAVVGLVRLGLQDAETIVMTSITMMKSDLRFILTSF
jgi:hypothetical protein